VAFDTILDFNHGQDSLDFLSTLGLTSVMPNDIGAATTLAAHTVGWQSDGTNTTVYANLGNGSQSIAGGTDMMKILLSNMTTLGAGDINTHA